MDRFGLSKEVGEMYGDAALAIGHEYDEDRLVMPDSKEARMSVVPFLHDAGIDISKLSQRAIDRLEMLHENTRHFRDELQSVEYIRRISDYIAKHDSARAFEDGEIEQIIVGTIFSDIGKTGPRGATQEQIQVITDMYGIDEKVSPNDTVAEFIQKFFPYRAPEMIDDYNGVSGIDSDMTMREFWDQHVYWSYDIIQYTGLPVDGIIAAATHHIMEGNIPIDMDEHGIIHALGVERKVGRPEVFVMMLDKYDAQIRRGGRTHDQAIAYLYDRVRHNKLLDQIDDGGELSALMVSCIRDIDMALMLQEDAKDLDSASAMAAK